MTKAQHTPGPWHRDGFNLSSIIRLKFPLGHPECKHTTGTYETIARCEGDNWDANARLIAAAPELLEALLIALPYVERMAMSDKVEIVRKAIAKAEGK